MPRYQDQYLHATGAIPGFFSDTLRKMYPANSLEARLFERKRIWSGILYDYDMTEEPLNSGDRPRESIWEYWGVERNNWGDNNMGDLQWTSGYCNLHYDMGVGVLHSFLRTGHSKAWQVAELMNHRRHTQTVYHHENGHPYVDGHSRYEKDDHGTALTSNRPPHCWSESMGLYYALTGDPFVGEAFKKSVDGAVWFVARAYARQLENMYAADEEIRYFGWPLLKLCSGVWYQYSPAYYGVMVHLFDKMIVPMEKRLGPGFMSDETGWSQMQGYMVPPLTFLYQTLKPTETSVKDTLKQVIYRLYERAEQHIESRGGDNLRTPGYFYQPRYTGINALDNIGHTDNYAFVAKHFNKPAARMQALANAMTCIGYHQRFTTSRDSAAFDYYSRALFRSNALPATETKLHGKIGLHGRVMMSYEYDSLCPVLPKDGELSVVAAEKSVSGKFGELKITGVRPNPFNPSTKIHFNLPAGQIKHEITFTVYDMLGRMVNSVSTMFPRAGNVSIEWNGKDSKGVFAASGIYFGKLTAANGKTSLVKLTLMK
ncbi:MAG: T9SS type A sorting domain-containing protein, partial [Fibrobacteres bacterium]|nr:T9SS type A sorting domain-containing protein [Fibrobacterota bacterium]